MFLITPIYLLI